MNDLSQLKCDKIHEVLLFTDRAILIFVTIQMSRNSMFGRLKRGNEGKDVCAANHKSYTPSCLKTELINQNHPLLCNNAPFIRDWGLQRCFYLCEKVQSWPVRLRFYKFLAFISASIWLCIHYQKKTLFDNRGTNNKSSSANRKFSSTMVIALGSIYRIFHHTSKFKNKDTKYVSRSKPCNLWY